MTALEYDCARVAVPAARTSDAAAALMNNLFIMDTKLD
jgi:hypothetical protein